MDAVTARVARIVKDKDSDTVSRTHVRLKLPRRVGFPPGFITETGCQECTALCPGCDIINFGGILFQGAVDEIVCSLYRFERAISPEAIVYDRESSFAGLDALHHLRVQLADMLAKRMPAAHLFFGENDRVPTVGVIRDLGDPRIVTGIISVARTAIRPLAAIRMSGRHAGLIGVVRTERQTQSLKRNLNTARRDQPSRLQQCGCARGHRNHPLDQAIMPIKE
nr:hypothetical protein [Methylobacterium sp. W2]